MQTRWMTAVCVRAFIVTSLFLFTSTAMAEWEIYNEGETKLIFNVDVLGAGFLQDDSWFGASDEFLGADTDNWFELGIEPKASFETGAGKGILSAQLSGVATRTWGDDASGLTVDQEETHEIALEQANIGWSLGEFSSRLEEEEFSVIVGRQDYNIGTGLIINDGAGDGAGRGGWYLGMRKTFQESVLVRLKSTTWVAEGFALENRPRAGGTKGDILGGNLEYTFGESLTLGGTYMDVDVELPDTDSLDVLSGRVDWKAKGGLGLGGEYVNEESDQIDASGYYGQVSYEFQEISWSPVFSYRYAYFSGDDPDTSDDERFREIAYGYTDYGSWYQGEITGNYPLGNSNLISHQVRAKAQPREGLALNAIYYNFTLDEPQSLGSSVTDDHWGDEINLTADWQATARLLVIGVFGVLFPGDAAEQFVGSDGDWISFMLLGSYSW